MAQTRCATDAPERVGSDRCGSAAAGRACSRRALGQCDSAPSRWEWQAVTTQVRRGRSGAPRAATSIWQWRSARGSSELADEWPHQDCSRRACRQARDGAPPRPPRRGRLQHAARDARGQRRARGGLHARRARRLVDRRPGCVRPLRSALPRAPGGDAGRGGGRVVMRWGLVSCIASLGARVRGAAAAGRRGGRRPTSLSVCVCANLRDLPRARRVRAFRAPFAHAERHECG